MSKLGRIEIYNVIINDMNDNLSHINQLSENIVLTNSQINTLILKTENKILNGIPQEFNTFKKLLMHYLQKILMLLML